MFFKIKILIGECNSNLLRDIFSFPFPVWCQICPPRTPSMFAASLSEFRRWLGIFMRMVCLPLGFNVSSNVLILLAMCGELVLN